MLMGPMQRILILKSGRPAEEDTQGELLRKGSIYANLYKLQYARTWGR